MKIFIFKITALGLVLLGLFYGVDYLIQEGIKKSSYREISKWSEVIQGGIDAEVLIVGSSRALVHFDPKIIEEKTGMTCYNLGLDGSKYEAQKKVLELYLEKNLKPKILIWSLDFSSFEEVEGIYRYEQFIPFWSEKSIKSILKLNKGMDLEYLNYPIVRFSNNSSIKYRGLLRSTSLEFHEPSLYKGFRKPYQTWDGKFDSLKKQNPKGISIVFQEELFRDFTALHQKLLEQQIAVEWIIAPYLEEYNQLLYNREDLLSRLTDEAKQLNVPFFDYSSSEVSHSRDNFYNATHLNEQGVDWWMGEIGKH